MDDVRYTAIGHLNELSKTLHVEMGLPRNIVPPEQLTIYNLTTKLNDSHVLNVIMVNLKNPTDELDEINDYQYELKINLTQNINIDHREADFDLKNSEILFLLAHDNGLSNDNITEIKSEIFKYYTLAKHKSRYISEAYPKVVTIVSGRPRTLGMSIIKK